jgi:hypothetical protein
MPLPIDDINCLSTVTEADKTRWRMAEEMSKEAWQSSVGRTDLSLCQLCCEIKLLIDGEHEEFERSGLIGFEFSMSWHEHAKRVL